MIQNGTQHNERGNLNTQQITQGTGTALSVEELCQTVKMIRSGVYHSTSDTIDLGLESRGLSMIQPITLRYAPFIIAVKAV